MISEIIPKDKKNIEDMIYEIRGKQVMLDSDLAMLYKCKNGTKSINLAVKRNLNRFPDDFYFQLTEEEINNIYSRFQFETLNKKQGYNIKYLPYAFTEQGIAMLASVIHTEVAEEVSIKIMRTFVNMRHFIKDNNDVFKSLNNINTKILEHEDLLVSHDNKINELFDKFDKKDNHLFLSNTTFDSYVDILNIFKLAKKELIIIDNYADINTLNLIKKLNVKVTIISNNKKYLTKEDIDKYNSEYNNLNVIFNNSFHDRYIIIDNKEVYFLGSSINNIGSKISSVIKCSDEDINKLLLDKVKEIRKEETI